MAGLTTRKQAARLAVLAFVAADCAGIYYVQHRMDRAAAEAEQLAYAEPLAPVAGPQAPTFPVAAPALALAVPSLAAPASVAPVSAAPVAAPALAVAPVSAPRRLAAAPVPANPARVAPAHLAATLPSADAPAPARHAARHQAHAAAPAFADGAFANAFSLYDEAPEAEHRFGQGEDHGASGNLADLVAPRDEPAPLFDRAGIAPVTGQAATVDAPAAPEAAAPDAAELPAIKG
ncbi:hypothetical protein ACFOD9_01830 [Novosphingobium bradum]|uniref:Meckel syndrome type 1 protein n=1 Tax=Novosphingobium bradum TaxID=1737444 RepID=A0ABV7IJW4_9SPHN